MSNFSKVGETPTIEVKIVEDETIVDLATSTSKKIKIFRPDGSQIERDATFVTDGTDGKIFIVTQDGDLSMKGNYRIEAEILFPAHTNPFQTLTKILPVLPQD